MELTIDKSGRVVFPKKLREHLGVRNGLKVQVIETGDGVLLRPHREPSGLVRKNGILIHRGTPSVVDSTDIVEAIEKEREARIRETAGI